MASGIGAYGARQKGMFLEMKFGNRSINRIRIFHYNLFRAFKMQMCTTWAKLPSGAGGHVQGVSKACLALNLASVPGIQVAPHGFDVPLSLAFCRRQGGKHWAPEQPTRKGPWSGLCQRPPGPGGPHGLFVEWRQPCASTQVSAQCRKPHCPPSPAD